MDFEDILKLKYYFVYRTADGRLHRDGVKEADVLHPFLSDGQRIVLRDKLNCELEAWRYNRMYFELKEEAEQLYKKFPGLFTEERKQQYAERFDKYLKMFEPFRNCEDEENARYMALRSQMRTMLSEIKRVEEMGCGDWLE